VSNDVLEPLVGGAVAGERGRPPEARGEPADQRLRLLVAEVESADGEDLLAAAGHDRAW
jgi:hypothetical protein